MEAAIALLVTYLFEHPELIVYAVVRHLWRGLQFTYRHRRRALKTVREVVTLIRELRREWRRLRSPV